MLRRPNFRTYLRRTLQPVLLAVLLLVPVAAAPRDATEPGSLSVPRVNVIDNTAQVSVTFEGAFSPELVERIESGLPTGFTYDFELMRDRKHWWDAHLETSTLEVAAMYNAVSREYLVNFKLDGKLIESRLSRSLAELESSMTRVERLPLFALDDVPPHTRLLVRARVRLGSRTLFSLIPTRVETDWQESSKFFTPSLDSNATPSEP
ncbi:MAG: DUF4390 domain-containing protein [Thermoanaerobaculia bacterium]|nr:DUF4390 domain-containing protein [Thermoanaerobaculia bacterium]